MFSEQSFFRIAEFFRGVNQCRMNRIDPNSRDSEIDLNTSANTDLPRSQINADIIPRTLNESTEPNQMKSEEKESCDKCGRSEIPIPIHYHSQEPENSPKRKNKKSKSLETQMDGLETRMDYFEIRFGCIEKSLFAEKD